MQHPLTTEKILASANGHVHDALRPCHASVKCRPHPIEWQRDRADSMSHDSAHATSEGEPS